jgi:hypothetical protein
MGILGEILAGSFDTDAVLHAGDTFVSWRVSWVPFGPLPLVCRGKPL